MKHTIDNLRQVWEEAGYELSPYTEQEIQEAVEKHGPLPTLLMQYYKKIGRIGNEGHAFFVYPPGRLSIQEDGGNFSRRLLMFACEMQGVCDYGIDLRDTAQANPVAYCGGEPYYEIARQEDCFYIPGTHPGLAADVHGDTRTLMNALWTFAVEQLGTTWDFEDDEIYGYSNEERAMRNARQKVQKTAWEQMQDLEKLIMGQPVDCPAGDYLLVTQLELDCAASKNAEKPVPGACPAFGLLTKAENLQQLKLSNAVITDSTPLKALGKLRELDLRNCRISDFSFLEKMCELKVLYINNTVLEDLAILGKLKKLKEALLYNFAVPLVPLMKSLQGLYLLNTGTSDIAALSGMKKLAEFRCTEGGKIEDISALQDLPRLKELHLEGNRISDLSPLAGKESLTYVDLSDNPVEDFSPLASCSGIQTLMLSGTSFCDMNLLPSLKKLATLYLENTRISDIQALRDCKSLKQIILNGTNVSDLSPLGGLTKLNKLGVAHTHITDLSPIKDKPFRWELDLRGLRLPPLRQLAAGTEVYFPWSDQSCAPYTWQGYEDFLTNGFWKEYHQAQDKGLLDAYLEDLYSLESVTYPDIALENNDTFQYKKLLHAEFYHTKFLYEDIRLPATLEWLELREVTADNLDGALEKLVQLKVLDIRDCGFTDFSFLLRMPSLKIVIIEQEELADFQALKNILEQCGLIAAIVKGKHVPDKKYKMGASCCISLENGQVEIEPVE